jgi:hypothetical protein
MHIVDVLETFGEAGRSNLVNLSSNCSKYRMLLLPTVFRFITLRNTVKIATSVLVVANSRHMQYVRKLKYVGSLAMFDFVENGEDDDLDDSRDAAWMNFI